jgi:hypothetical protein
MLRRPIRPTKQIVKTLRRNSSTGSGEQQVKQFKVFYLAGDSIEASVECVEGDWAGPLSGQPTPVTLPMILSSFAPALEFAQGRVEWFVKKARPGSVFHGKNFVIVCVTSYPKHLLRRPKEK